MSNLNSMRRLINECVHVRKNGAFTYLQWMSFYSERWKWWFEVASLEGTPTTPYPEMGFATEMKESDTPYRMIKSCVSPFTYDHNVFNELVQFMLFSFGDSETPNLNHIDQRKISHFRRTIDLKVFLDYPGDYWGHFLEVHMSHGERSMNGFFTTPPALCKLMVDLTIEDDRQENLTKSFCDPCCGTLRMGLFASDKGVLQISGQDVSRTIYEVAKLNSYLYLPPTIFSRETMNKILNNN